MAPPIFAIPIQQDDFIPNFDSSSMNQDSSPTTVFNTPNGTLSWIPNVPVEFKPFVGMKFSKMDDIIKMYDRYVDLSGFSTRLSTLRKIEGVITTRYILYNKGGKPQTKRKFDTLDPSTFNIRQSTFKVTDCKACIRIKLCKVSSMYEVTLKGVHHNVRGTPNDYKNFAKFVRLFIGRRDSQLIIDKLKARSKHLPNFSFDFTLHDGQYNMIFVPFTGVDNHKRCVTYGAGLLFSETIESYTWLLDAFLKTHCKQPLLVLTDQDPAMKQAVAAVFTQSRHRLCMWHIMKKLPSKISGDLLNNTSIRSDIHKLVWNVYIKPSTFETRWHSMLEQHNLTDHEWLNDVYSIRELWVPAYFRDIHMCCLMKTTSRCEILNASFKVNSTWANTLLQFLFCFDATMDAQRYHQRMPEFNTFSTFSDLITGSQIEKHASTIYSRSIFNDVRKEISKGMFCCFITTVVDVDGLKSYTVTHVDKNRDFVNDFTVKMDPVGDCVNQIPDKYISSRWRRGVLPKSVYNLEHRYGVDQSKNIPQTVDSDDPVEDVIAELLGAPKEVEVTCSNPQGIRNKGCGRNRRLIGPGEKSILNHVKTPRLCKTCMKYVVGHDSHNCPTKSDGTDIDPPPTA
ncbi:hypothetical protein QVD17_30366 [Tagetes erecta]|uniref:MULE transposase domain-containing protein n=1 Tax=Tagetes erecta TaxID=13708 RepID=A0AAD8NMX1_TARER|nr:hypothetical protein QVD17_30366 [Tagetes erecta]